MKWIVGLAFAGGILSAILSIVFRVDSHVMAFPHPILAAIAAGLFAVGIVAGVAWAAIAIFGG